MDGSAFRKLRSNAVFLLASSLMACLLLAAVEGVLRVAGIGDRSSGNSSRLGYQRIYLPILEPGERRDGTPVLRPADKRLPYHSLLREEPENALRIFTFGGSATAGLGYSPNATFTRFLERMLRESERNRSVELSNLGIVALASEQVKLLVEDVCRRYEPDLIIVYSGNNEFLEPHALKYALAQSSTLERILDRLRDTHLRRLADRAINGPPVLPPLAEQDFSADEMRLTQEAIIRDVEMSPEEVAEVVDRYAANLEEMVEVAKATETPMILMTVASNWRWRGRKDLPDNWLSDLLGDRAEADPGAYQRARGLLSERMKRAPANARAELLFRRAVAAEALGDLDSARADYRAAMNQDPHLRRALDVMNDRLKGIAVEHGVSLVDTVEELARRAEGEIIGFREFYDYVHFTPRGALLVAMILFEEIRRLGLMAGGDGFDPERFMQRELAGLDAAGEDSLSSERWIGFGFEKALLGDRDLWKYERMLKRLDARLEADPRDLRALVYRANARSFELGGAAAAASDYRAALAIAPTLLEVRENLDRLAAEGRL